jgi:hypothetical protein
MSETKSMIVLGLGTGVYPMTGHESGHDILLSCRALVEGLKEKFGPPPEGSVLAIILARKKSDVTGNPEPIKNPEGTGYHEVQYIYPCESGLCEGYAKLLEQEVK